MNENKILEACMQVLEGGKPHEDTVNCDSFYCSECPFSRVNNNDIGCGHDTQENYQEIAKRYIKEHSPIKEEIKTEKTFREVIADIKEGEVWESKEGINGIVAIKEKDEIVIRDSEDNLIAYIADTWKFKLQRKQYTFQEAFKAYEEGKEIESCCTGTKYKIEKLIYFYKRKNVEDWQLHGEMQLNEIRSKWYINN